MIADVPPQGHASWLARLLQHSPTDTADGFRPLPWLTPSLVIEGESVAWVSSCNMLSIMHNGTLLFCPGAIINGQPQPFVATAGEVTSPLCTSTTLSLACPRVFHTTLQSGSNSTRDFGLYTFPWSVLHHLETAEYASWLAPFRPPSSCTTWCGDARASPKTLSIRFGAHRASIYGNTKAAKTAALTTSTKDQVRESHARDLICRHPRPEILDEVFQEYRQLLDKA